PGVAAPGGGADLRRRAGAAPRAPRDGADGARGCGARPGALRGGGRLPRRGGGGVPGAGRRGRVGQDAPGLAGRHLLHGPGERGDAVLVARQDQNIAYVYAGQGHYTRALQRDKVAFALQERAGFAVEAAWSALNMVHCYLGLNMIPEALALAEETVETFARCG